MVEVSIEVRSGSASFKVAVRAQSIQRAVSLVQSRHPEGDVRVKFPIDPKVSLVKVPATRSAVAGRREQPDKVAA